MHFNENPGKLQLKRRERGGGWAVVGGGVQERRGDISSERWQ